MYNAAFLVGSPHNKLHRWPQGARGRAPTGSVPSGCGPIQVPYEGTYLGDSVHAYFSLELRFNAPDLEARDPRRPLVSRLCQSREDAGGTPGQEVGQSCGGGRTPEIPELF